MKYSIKDFDEKVQHIYQNDNQVVTHLNIKADQIIPTHDTSMSVVVVIYEGEVIFTEEDKEFTIKPGDIIQLDPGLAHSLKATKDSKLMVIKSDLK